MKPFDLEAAKKGDPIVTREGKAMKFIAYVPEALPYLKIVCLTDKGVFTFYQETGRIYHEDLEHPADLFMAPPPMRSINGYEYPEPIKEPLDPEPIKEPLEQGQTFFIVDIYSDQRYVECHWSGSDYHNRAIERGLAHLTKKSNNSTFTSYYSCRRW